MRSRIWLLGLLVGLLFASFSVWAQDTAVDLTLPELGSFDPASVSDIVVEDYPVLPEVTDYARVIYAQGVENGLNPQVFSKVGDCMTATTPYFLGPFGSDGYDLGEYGALQDVIDYFSIPARGDGFDLNSFANPGLGTATGFNTASVLDSIWADPSWCNANESPLSCEYRVSQPAFSLIMFGTNDVMFFEPGYFDYYLRTIVLETINDGIVPVLYTFPTRPEFPDKTYQFNQIVIKISQDYDLPLVNLWAAIEDLPNHGVDTLEPTHLSVPDDLDTGILDAEHLQAGYTVRNLITLQTLQILMDGLTTKADE